MSRPIPASLPISISIHVSISRPISIPIHIPIYKYIGTFIYVWSFIYTYTYKCSDLQRQLFNCFPHCFSSGSGVRKGSPNIKRFKTNKSTVCHLHEGPTYLRHTTERHRKQVALIQLGLLRQPSFHILLRSKRTYGQPLPLLLSFFRPPNELNTSKSSDDETAGGGGGSAKNLWLLAQMGLPLYLCRRAPPKRVFFHPPT